MRLKRRKLCQCNTALFLKDLANAVEWGNIFVPLKAIDGGGLLAGDAVDERPFADHDFEDALFEVRIEEVRGRLLTAKHEDSGRESVGPPVADTGDDEII